MSGNSPRRAVTRVLSVVMALAMITSVFAGGVLAQDSSSDVEVADEVYVTDDGDALLVQEEDNVGSGTGEVGVDVTEGIVYALVTDEQEDDLSAAFDMWVDSSGLESSTEVTTERPEDLEEFSMDVTGSYTDEEATFDADLELTVGGAGQTAMLDKATTSGSIESGADRFATSGEYRVETPFPPEEPTERFDLSVSGTEGDYTLDIRQRQPLGSDESDQLENETVAQAVLEEQFGQIADDLGGDATVTIHDHTVEKAESGQKILDIEYTVEYEGLEELDAELKNELVSENDELDEEQIDALTDAALAADLETVDVSHVQNHDGALMDGSWDVEVSNVGPLAEQSIAIAEATDDGELAEMGVFDDLRAQMEAQSEADLTQTVEWDAAVTSDTEAETVTVDAAVSSDAENWAAYVDELEERGVERGGDLAFEAHGETVGDEIEFDLAVEANQDEFLDTTLAALTQELENDPAAGEAEREFLEAFEDADLQISGIDVQLDGTMTMTAGAKFDDLSAFQGIIEDETGLSVTHAYVDASEDTETTYLYVEEFVGENPTEDEVRATEFADDGTDVHLGASLEDHPRLDLEDANDFLDEDVADGDLSVGGDDEQKDGSGDDTDSSSDDGDSDSDTDDSEEENESTTDEDGDEDGDDSVPGFGVAAAIGVLLSVALLRVRN